MEIFQKSEMWKGILNYLHTHIQKNNQKLRKEEKYIE